MRRRHGWIGTVGIVLAACMDGPASPSAAPIDAQSAGPGAVLSSAAIRYEFPLFEQFDAVNPCSGLPMTVTIDGIVRVIDQDGREFVKIVEQTSTSDGFTGRTEIRDVFNGRNEILRIEGMLSSASGARFRVQRLLVVDLVNEELRVTSGGPVLTCVR